MQDDAFANPGYLWVAAGAEAYEKKQGAGSCMSCHGESGMVGVATRYPRFDEGALTLLNLEGRINVCRTEHQKLPALVYESQELLALSSFVAEQSRGMRTQVSVTEGRSRGSGRAKTIFSSGAVSSIWPASNVTISLGGRCCGAIGSAKRQPNAFPAYRLECRRWVRCIDDCKTARLGSEPNLKPWALAPISGWNSTWCGVREVWLWNHPGCADKTEKGKVRGLPR